MTGGRADRANRLRNFLSGPCASSSQDYVRLTNLLFEQSASYASATDGNCSVYALAGVPILFSALRALLIECNYGMYGAGRNEERLEVLSKSANEILFLAKNYKIPITLQQRLEILYEVRNEIIHPTHTPAGTSHGTPEYLVSLRVKGLLQSTNDEQSDYTWISQLQSHTLFGYAFAALEDVASIVLSEHHASDESRCLHLASYSRYKLVRR